MGNAGGVKNAKLRTIPTPPEFSFAECLPFLNRSPRKCLHYAGEGELIKPLPSAFPIGDGGCTTP